MNSLFSGIFFPFCIKSIKYQAKERKEKSQVHLSAKYNKVLSEAAVGMDYRVKKQPESDIMHKLTQGNTQIQHNKYIK